MLIMTVKCKVAIHVDNGREHSSSWAPVWIEFCENNKIPFKVVNCYSFDSIRELKDCNVLLWHFSHYSKQDMHFARSILTSAKSLGLRVFPDVADFWHFDDKVAQDYFFDASDIESPESAIFFSYNDVLTWICSDPLLPVVAKLRCGSGSQNVMLLSTRDEVLLYAKKMFKRSGFSTTPSLVFKAKSNLLSVKSFSDFYTRIKKVPDFFNTLKKSRSLPRESGYFYIQNFIRNDGYDLKVIVVGEKLSFIARRSRGRDFRASGGGDLFFEKSLVTPRVIDLCFEASDKLGSCCMGYDVVVEKNTGRPYIIEMSYGFSHSALLSAGGYWRRDHVWIEGSLNAPVEVLDAKLGC